MNLNLVKKTIVSIAALHKIALEEMLENGEKIGKKTWHLTYGNFDDQQELERLSNRVYQAISLHELTKKDQDWLAAKAGLLEASVSLQMISEIFRAYSNDLYTVMKSSDDFKWPEIPDDVDWPKNFARSVYDLAARPHIELNCVQSAIVSMAGIHGIAESEMQSNAYLITDPQWRFDYLSTNLQAEFDTEIRTFFDGVRLYETFSRNKDWVPAYNGLIFAMNAASGIRHFLGDVYHDIDLVMLNSKSMEWPEFPDGYVIPTQYKISF